MVKDRTYHTFGSVIVLLPCYLIQYSYTTMHADKNKYMAIHSSSPIITNCYS